MRRPRQRPRRFRFEASYPNRESFGVLIVQGLIQFFLIIALGFEIRHRGIMSAWFVRISLIIMGFRLGSCPLSSD